MTHNDPDPKNRYCALASLPPVVFGSGIGLAWLVIGNLRPAPSHLRLYAGLAIGLIAALVITFGAIEAIMKRLPEWGWPWLGGFLAGFILALQIIGEEINEMQPMSPWLDTSAGVMLILILIASALVAGWHGWRISGMFAIGFSAMIGLSLFHLFAIPPIFRWELATLAIPVGVLIGIVIFHFSRSSKALSRLASLAAAGIIVFGTGFLVNQAWEPEAGSFTRSPILAITIFAIIPLFVYPIISLAITPMKLSMNKQLS